jgi:hypothetical protein
MRAIFEPSQWSAATSHNYNYDEAGPEFVLFRESVSLASLRFGLHHDGRHVTGVG